MKKRVLHVLSSKDIAGAENVAMCVISNLSESFDLAYSSPKGEIERKLFNRGIEYQPIDKLTVRHIRKVIKVWKPDIIHAHDFTATIKCALATFLIPIVSHIHQNPKWIKKINVYSFIFFLTCLRLNKIIVVSPAMKEMMSPFRLFWKKTKVIKNIVDVNWIKEMAAWPAEKNYDVLFLGRLEEVKDPSKFIRIISYIAEKNPKVKAVMVGGGSLENRCKELVNEASLQKNIDMLGYLDNPYPILYNSKILVMTSISEGLPMVVIEALAFGKPVIVSCLEGIESLVDRSCGFICKDESDFIARIHEILNSTSLYENLSNGALIKAKQIIDMNRFKEEFKQVYESV